MSLLSQILQYVISGLTAGSIYAIIGICWSLVYLITKVLNFSSGEFVMLGGMLTWGFHAAGFGVFSAALLAIACTIVVAVLLERVAIRPVRYPTEITYMMITIAAASVIKGIILLIWGSETRSIEPFFGSSVIHILGATLTSQTLCVLGLLLVVTVGLSLFLSRTLLERPSGHRQSTIPAQASWGSTSAVSGCSASPLPVGWVRSPASPSHHILPGTKPGCSRSERPNRGHRRRLDNG